MLTLLLLPLAQAYEVTVFNNNEVWWPTNSVTFESASTNTAQERAWIEQAEELFYNQSSLFYYDIIDADDNTVATQNNENEIEFTSFGSNGPGGTVARRWSSSGENLECDIFMNTDIAWTGEAKSLNEHYTTLGYGQGGNPVATLVHELGHCAGFNHEGDTYNPLGNGQSHVHTNAGDVGAYIGVDLSAGLRYLYGTWNGVNELSASHWQWDHYNGGQAEHKRVGMFDSSLSLMNPWNGLEPIYTVVRGQTYYPQVTLENSGSSNQALTIAYRISTNDYITEYDMELSRDTFLMANGTPYTATAISGLTIPTTLAPDIYYIGVQVDPDNDVVELREDNNFIYLFAVEVD